MPNNEENQLEKRETIENLEDRLTANVLKNEMEKSSLSEQKVESPQIKGMDDALEAFSLIVGKLRYLTRYFSHSEEKDNAYVLNLMKQVLNQHMGDNIIVYLPPSILDSYNDFYRLFEKSFKKMGSDESPSYKKLSYSAVSDIERAVSHIEWRIDDFRSRGRQYSASSDPEGRRLSGDKFEKTYHKGEAILLVSLFVIIVTGGLFMTLNSNFPPTQINTIGILMLLVVAGLVVLDFITVFYSNDERR